MLDIRCVSKAMFIDDLLFSHCRHCACGCLTSSCNHKRSRATHESFQEDKRMTTNGEFFYVLNGLGLAALSGLMAALLVDKQPRQLRERSGKSLDYLRHQTGKLRQTAGVILQGGKKLMLVNPPIRSFTQRRLKSKPIRKIGGKTWEAKDEWFG